MEALWKERPAGSNWGDFGPDDQVGRMNLITSDVRVKAFEEVKSGDVFCLSLPLDFPAEGILTKNRKPPVRSPVRRPSGELNISYEWANEDERLTDVSCDDSVLIFTQHSTQWDALSHIGGKFDADGDGADESVFYNGHRIEGHDQMSLPPLGIENLAQTCVQGRGVLLDFLEAFGTQKSAFGYDDVMRTIELFDVIVEAGDILCIRTGFSEEILRCNGRPDPATLNENFGALDGRDQRLLAWIDDTGIVAIAADNFAVEIHPNKHEADVRHAALPLHEHCLFKLGIHLGELWYFGELAPYLHRHGRSRFLLTAPPLRLSGAFGSPVTPVATV